MLALTPQAKEMDAHQAAKGQDEKVNFSHELALFGRLVWRGKIRF
jgi:hypothetical protein